MSVSKVLRNSFVAGFAILAPLAVTGIVLQWAFARLTTVIDPIVEGTRLTQYTANDHLSAQLLAAGLLFGTIALVGFVASRSVGRRAFDGFDTVMGHVPLVRVIYSSVRQVSDALLEGEHRYESVVLVEYPREGVYSLGFVTNDGPPAVDAAVGEPVVNVFVPHSPNPTAGHLLLVPEDELRRVDVSVRKALRMLVTTGMAQDEHEELPGGEAIRMPADPAEPTEPADD